MPKGVEHFFGSNCSGIDDPRVIHSLMPKGVEHTVTPASRNDRSAVIHSLMPKGVEHFVPATSAKVSLACDSFVDAERR